MTEYLTVHETAERLSISVATVYRLIDKSELPSVKIGRARRVPSERLDAYLDSKIVPTDADALSVSVGTES